MFLAPVGYRGRLAHISSYAAANQAIFNNSGWIGARTFMNDSSDAANFFWYENQMEPIGNLSFLPVLYNFGELIIVCLSMYESISLMIRNNRT